MTTIHAALVQATEQLHQAGITDAEREASWLLAALLGISVGSLRVRESELLQQPTTYARWVERRTQREPIQYILGTEEFMDLEFVVTPDVLIPRRDTETLVRVAAELLVGKGPVHVADIGTGSGAIAIALASLLPQATLIAVDLSEGALPVAQANAARNGVADRIQFRRGDLVAPLAGEQFDAILSNPPYIGLAEVPDLMPEVREWEPMLALTPGADGLLIYRRLIGEALPLLKSDGFLAVEVGADQAAEVRALFEAAGLHVLIRRDTSGIERAVVGLCP
jgi:release factor glutamine methyltransferase